MAEENLIWQSRPPWRAYISMFAMAAFAAGLLYYAIFTYLPQAVAAASRLGKFVIYIYFAPAVLVLVIIGAVTASRYSHLYTITDKYASSRVGLIRRDERSALIAKITDIHVSQGVWQRVLNYGNVQINTAGSSSYEVNFISVGSPYYIQSVVEGIIEHKGVKEK